MLSKLKGSHLPFEDGLYLNVHREISCPTYEPISCVPNREAGGIVTDLVQSSTLDPICQIRRDPDLKAELCSKLEKLVKETTLDEQQLLSFVDSLRYKVHLTQGPPGTGSLPKTSNYSACDRHSLHTIPFTCNRKIISRFVPNAMYSHCKYCKRWRNAHRILFFQELLLLEL